MAVEPRGQAIRVMINLVNRKREEPTGCGGGRQPSLDRMSRVTGACHARICERLGVKNPRGDSAAAGNCCPYRDLNSQCISQIRISGNQRVSCESPPTGTSPSNEMGPVPSAPMVAGGGPIGAPILRQWSPNPDQSEPELHHE